MKAPISTASYEAAENIRDVFSPLAGTELSDAGIDAAELSVRADIRAVYLALFGMAVAELEMKSKASAWYFLSTVSYEFDEIAHITAETPYSTRGEDNFLEITNLILRFFSGEGKTEKRDLFFFLRGISSVNLSHTIKEISRTEKRLMHYIFSCRFAACRGRPAVHARCRHGHRSRGAGQAERTPGGGG